MLREERGLGVTRACGLLGISSGRRAIENWRIDYNTERPHSSLGNLTPEEYAKNGLARVKQAELSTADSSSRPY